MPPQLDPETLPRERQLEWAREIALRRLDQRAYTKAELRLALLQRKCPADVAEELLSSFEGVGLLDDAQFAADWVVSRHGRRNRSRLVVVGELRRKGVADDLIAAATAEIDQESELSAAHAVAATHLKRLSGLEYPVAYRRLAGALARRGYAPSVVSEVVRETLLDWSQ
ncbi:MAG: recombination regulator RecX [Propionibacteriaceae bacterium]|jgi:regulatory protein|nr:recombination regulator RecX [Propionibacteriaceae bacterium]